MDASARPDASDTPRRRLPGRRTSVVVGALTILVFACVGGVVMVLYDDTGPLWLLYPDGELTVPALVSGVALLVAAWLAHDAGRLDATPFWWNAMALFFGFMAFDELVGVHERIERHLGIDWQVIYVPVVVVGAVVFVAVARRLGSALLVAGWVAGAGAWFVAQIFELLQWDGATLIHRWMILPEEVLELTGSILWSLTLLEHVRDREAAGQSAIEGAVQGATLPEVRPAPVTDP